MDLKGVWFQIVKRLKIKMWFSNVPFKLKLGPLHHVYDTTHSQLSASLKVERREYANERTSDTWTNTRTDERTSGVEWSGRPCRRFLCGGESGASLRHAFSLVSLRFGGFLGGCLRRARRGLCRLRLKDVDDHTTTTTTTRFEP